jgi:hypothetical protein
MEKKLTNSDPLRESADKHSIYTALMAPITVSATLDQQGHLNEYVVHNISVPLLVRRAKLGFVSQG